MLVIISIYSSPVIYSSFHVTRVLTLLTFSAPTDSTSGDSLRSNCKGHLVVCLSYADPFLSAAVSVRSWG